MLTLDLYQSWDDFHEETQYPFADGAALVSVDGSTSIRAGVIVDAAIGVRDIAAVVYVSAVVVKAAEVDVVFSQGTAAIATATITSSSDGWIALVSAAGGMLYAGKIKINPLAVGALFDMGIGTHVFTAAATPLVPYAAFLSPSTGVTGVVLPSGEVLTGDITLFLGSGIDAELRDDGAVILHATGLPFVGRDAVTELKRGIRNVEVSARSADGSLSVATIFPVRGAIGAMTDHANPARSPAIVINGSGAEISVEVAQ